MKPIGLLLTIKKPLRFGRGRVLTTCAAGRMLTVRMTAGVSLPPASVKMQSSTKSVQIPRQTRPVGRSDNDGSLPVSAYRGIGSETVRRPVVIAGRDPNKAMAG
jgi:hypothetical protein